MKRALCALGVLLLLLAAVPLGALAADHTVTLGIEESIPFNMMASSDCTYSLVGSVPGMSLTQFRGALTLEGTPTAAGTYTVILTQTAPDGTTVSETLFVEVVDPAGSDAPVDSPSPVVTKNPTGEKVIEGQSAQFVARADNTYEYVWELLTFDGGTVLCKDLPGIFTGLGVTGSNTERLTLTNIPVALDGCRVRCRFIGYEDFAYSEYALIQVTALADAYPKVTKDPTAETVQEGSMAQFVARADNVTEYLWMLTSPDGTVSYPCTGQLDRFPELKISGGNTECLTLNAIPYSLNGWKVHCIFTGPLGTVASTDATVSVIPLPTEATEPPTETTEPPTETTAPPTEATEPPTQPTTQPPTQTTEPPTEPEKQPASRGNSTLAIVAIIAAAVVAVAAVVGIVIIKLKDGSDEEEEEYEEDGE